MPAPAIAAGLALLHLVLAVIALQPAPYVGGDNGAYVALAQSLAERGTYLELWDPAQRPHTQYPPLFPLLLAAAMKVGVGTWIGFKLVTAACSGAAVAASYLWMRRASTPGVALAAGALLAILPRPLELAHEVLSDVPFWALALLALWAAVPCEKEERARLGWALAAAGLAAAAYMTRSAGLPLIVALAASFALRRRWRELGLLAAVTGAPAVLWWMRGRALGAAGYTAHLRYVDPYQPSLGTLDAAGWAGRVAQNLAHYIGEHLPVVLGGTEPLRIVVGCVIVVLALAGWARRLRRARAAELFLPLYAGLLLIWPATWSGERFLLPILPLLLVYAGESVRDGAATLRMPPRGIGVAAAVALALVVLPGTAQHLRDGRLCMRAYLDGDPLPCLTPEWHDLLAVPMKVRGRLPPGAVVLSRKPTLFYVLSGYPSRIYPPSADPEAFFRAAREAGAEWVLIDRVPDLAPMFLHPVLRARPGDFCVVRNLSLPSAALARIVPGGTPPTDPGLFRRLPDPLNCGLTPLKRRESRLRTGTGMGSTGTGRSIVTGVAPYESQDVDGGSSARNSALSRAGAKLWRVTSGGGGGLAGGVQLRLVQP